MQNAAAIVYTGGCALLYDGCPSAMGELLFRPVAEWVNAALDALDITDRCYVRHEGEDALKKCTGDSPVFVHSAGEGHPILSAGEWVKKREEKNIIVLCAEAPFVDEASIQGALSHHIENNHNMTVLASGGRTAFIKELANSAFWIKGVFLSELFEKADPEDKDGKAFIPNALKVISGMGTVAGTFVAGKQELNMRVENAEGLLMLNAAARTIVFKKLCASGVQFTCTDGIIIAPTAKIGAGTKILPGTIIKGSTEIGKDCVIGPNSYIEDSTIGDETEVNSTQIRSARLENRVKIGPWSQVRPGSVIHDGCKIGDYVEIKNSEVGARTAIAHLTYVGDSDVGEGVNFGCGCCIANYDGQHKHRTKIGDHAFLGCNTNLIAPVELGSFAYTAAGSTITKNVPDYALAVGRAKQENIADWVKKHDAIKIK